MASTRGDIDVHSSATLLARLKLFNFIISGDTELEKSVKTRRINIALLWHFSRLNNKSFQWPSINLE